MAKPGNLPDIIAQRFSEQGVDSEQILAVAAADMNNDFELKECWVALTMESIYIIRGVAAYPKHKFLSAKKQKDKKPVDPISYITEHFESYSMSDIEKPFIENLFSSACLAATYKGELITLATFSVSKNNIMKHISGLIGKIKGPEPKEGEERQPPNPLTEDDLKVPGADMYCPKCGTRFKDKDKKQCVKCDKLPSPMLRLTAFAVKYKFQIFVILLFMVTNALLGVVRPYLSGKVLFDDVLTVGGENYGRIGWFIIVRIGLDLFSMLFSMIRNVIVASMVMKISLELRQMMFANVQRLSLRFFSGRQTGVLMRRINEDAGELQSFFIDGVPSIIMESIQIIGVSTMLFMMNWKLTLIMLASIPLITLSFNFFHMLLESINVRTWVRRNKMGGILNEVLYGMRVVKAFAKEKDENKKYDKASNQVFEADMISLKATSAIFPVLWSLISVCSLLLWYIGGWDSMKGILTFGELQTFIQATGMLIGPFRWFSNFAQWYAYNRTAAQRVFDMLDAKSEITEIENPYSPGRFRGEVELKGVNFSYDINKPVLKNIEFHVPAGNILGLVGHTGSGKSTIANLITRLYDPDSGEIFIDGVNIKDISLNDVRNNIAIVSQEIYLFMGSIAQNISYAKPDATREEIISAAKAANAHDFIMKLPYGYDTKIGVGGQDLSGGERQRVSIARALLRNPTILILDEATASMDTETERMIHQALSELVKGRTTIMIAHRLSTLRDANKLVVLENGEITETGTQAELLKKKGTYHKLFTLQNEALKVIGIG